MAVFRVEKTRDYTVMSNWHLKDKNLSLKSKGLLSVILSLPDNWNFTTRGLAAICKEGVDSIGVALRELEGAGYIIRRRLRDEKAKSLIPNIPSTNVHRRRALTIRVLASRIRLSHIRKTRIWLIRIRTNHVRKAWKLFLSRIAFANLPY